MSDQMSPAGNLRAAPSHMHTQRIRTFIIVLSVLNLAFVALGLLDLRASPLTLVLALVAYIYYLIYYALLRIGYGVHATYGCVVLLLILAGVGVHNSGGFLMATTALYFLLLIGAAMVLNDERALDIIVMLCLAGYGALVFYELYFPPPALMEIYLTATPLLLVSIPVTLLVSLVGVWLVMRNSLAGLRHSTAASETARAEAEVRARENAALAAQVQTGAELLLATQAHLRDTIEALTLPLIPLDNDVALLPLIGYLDATRADRLVQGVLQGIYEQRARTVILDITGLREIDARVATTLLQVAGAARLLGTRVVLSGVGAATAQTLVELDADISGLQTAGRLSDALHMATAVESAQ